MSSGSVTIPEPATASSPARSDEAAPPAAPRLRSLAVKGAIWTFAGHGATQALRLGGNLILTRLLFPEAFGLMALVQVVTRGLEMFSNIGVDGSVIRDPRGDEPGFLNTAWTLRVIRGIGLWLMASLVAWPASWLYDQPLLLWMIPVTGLTSVVTGFESIAALTCRRHVRLKPLVIRDIAGSILGLIIMVLLAVLLKSVWALVIGTLVRVVVVCGLSYVMLPGPRASFAWDHQALKEMYRFGRWLFISTALSFLLQQGDRAILGGLITAKELGIYTIAAVLAQFVVEILRRLTQAVLFPIFSKIANTEPHHFQEKYHRARRLVLAFLLPACWVQVLFGQQLVGLLYDARYAAAGVMLQILAVGSAGEVVTTTMRGYLLALGDSFTYSLVHFVKSLLYCVGMVLGWYCGGFVGLLLGMSMSRIVCYPVFAFYAWRYGLWNPAVDGVSLGLTVLTAFGALYAHA